jgi:TfoX/Sxy family transcriptional regulator of competence genes
MAAIRHAESGGIMPSRQDVADFLLEQLGRLEDARARRMFGEFGFYVGDRFVAVVCDDQLFMKPTEGGRAYFPDFDQGVPFPGAKPWLVVPGELWEDAAWLCGLFAVTAREVPPVKPARRKAGDRPGQA